MNAIVKFPPCFFKKPTFLTKPSIFLAGTIEMGNSIDWQAYAIKELSTSMSVIFNPRRDEWDSSWVQEIDAPDFNTQVTWELQHMEHADLIMMYFDPMSKSPITLLELGLAAGKYPGKLHVCCPEGFYRKGNVDIVCNTYGVATYETLDALLDNVKAL